MCEIARTLDQADCPLDLGKGEGEGGGGESGHGDGMWCRLAGNGSHSREEDIGSWGCDLSSCARVSCGEGGQLYL